MGEPQDLVVGAEADAVHPGHESGIATTAAGAGTMTGATTAGAGGASGSRSIRKYMSPAPTPSSTSAATVEKALVQVGFPGRAQVLESASNRGTDANDAE